MAKQWTQATKPSLSGSQKRKAAKSKKSNYSAPSGSQHGRSNVVTKAPSAPKPVPKQNDKAIEAETKRMLQESAKITAALQAKDKAAAKVKADKIEKADKEATKKALATKEYDKGIALAAKKAKVKRDNIAKAKALEAASRNDVPMGTPLSGSVHERNVDPVERMPINDGAGMLGAGVAYYPTGKGETIGDNMPNSALGYLNAAINPMSATLKTVGQTAWNQQQYGMNEEASNLYQELIQDPSNANKSVKELVQEARKPQMDRQLDHAFINNGITNTANESQLANMRPQGITESQWTQMPLEFKRFLTRNMNNGLGSKDSDSGMLTGAPAAPAPTAPVAPTLGQLTTGDYTPTERPAWAPQPSMFDNIMPQPQQPSFAPQWNPNAAAPSWAPQARSMLDAPMRLQAPPSRFFK
tara:strand:+ start:789 stop:2027 length:1239 start_codon:yes stop_codon:yes gene_type:complete